MLRALRGAIVDRPSSLNAFMTTVRRSERSVIREETHGAHAPDGLRLLSKHRAINNFYVPVDERPVNRFRGICGTCIPEIEAPFSPMTGMNSALRGKDLGPSVSKHRLNRD